MAIFLDAHVHIYPGVAIEKMLNAAVENFNLAALRVGATGTRDYVLCLTETTGINVFSQLQKLAESVGNSNNVSSHSSVETWKYQLTPSPYCLKAINTEQQAIYIFAGRQLISSEDLEVLSLCAAESFPDRTYNLEDLCQKVSDNGGIPVIPWGVGKWLGKRKITVENYITNKRDFPVLLGDNGNRPVFWPLPKVLSHSSESATPIASGSDPLNLPDHHLRAGSYGGWVKERHLDIASPVTDLKAILVHPGLLVPFGKQTGIFSFFHDQLLVNLRKRLPNLFS